jgi:hypothetical protein
MIAGDEPLRRAGKTGLILAGLRCAHSNGARPVVLSGVREAAARCRTGIGG